MGDDPEDRDADEVAEQDETDQAEAQQLARGAHLTLDWPLTTRRGGSGASA